MLKACMMRRGENIVGIAEISSVVMETLIVTRSLLGVFDGESAACTYGNRYEDDNDDDDDDNDDDDADNDDGKLRFHGEQTRCFVGVPSFDASLLLVAFIIKRMLQKGRNINRGVKHSRLTAFNDKSQVMLISENVLQTRCQVLKRA